MATIKSFTSLEQSKKLSKILPIESADMCYMYLGIEDKKYQDIPICAPAMEGDLCAWSLSALLGVLPDTIDGIESYGRLTIDKEGDAYNISYDDILSEESIILFSEYSLIDACVAMIRRLHELKIL